MYNLVLHYNDFAGRAKKKMINDCYELHITPKILRVKRFNKKTDIVLSSIDLIDCEVF